ncbi:hypothetical protein Ciccas_006150 [Cichlidogyrus casuarinus]|uniref:non-specific serine/threonine protein kinase n=1 Tax=Cichlidogyrus casuarinus TaxID=1844966 RepID=A0ABD2Q7T2_9PLAT
MALRNMGEDALSDADMHALLTACLRLLGHSSRTVRHQCLSCENLLNSLRSLVVHAFREPRLSSLRDLLGSLIGAILSGLNRDQDSKMRLLYAQWIGTLGPVDPSRLPVKALSRGLDSADVFIDQRMFSHLLLQELAKIYMRAASPKQLDSTALSIQELLSLLGVTADMAAPRNPIRKNARTFSKYALESFTDWSSLRYPIFTSASIGNCNNWIRPWCGALISHVKDPFVLKTLQLCEPVIKADSDFARFLLNHVALQVVLDGSESGCNLLLQEMQATLAAISHSHKSLPQSKSQLVDAPIETHRLVSSTGLKLCVKDDVHNAENRNFDLNLWSTHNNLTGL